MKHEKESSFRREPQQLAVGNICTRAMTARVLASVLHTNVTRVIEELWPQDKQLLQLVTRASVAPATTFTTGWAAELAVKIVADTIEALSPSSGAADVLREALVLDWNGAGVISAPGFVASANNSGFVKEGDPIPVRQLAIGPAQLLPYKLATIAALTREMVESSNAERLIGDCLVRSTGLALDAVFFGSGAAVANKQPAGIRNGIAALTASANTDPFAAVFEDVATLINAVGAVGGKGPFLIVSGPGRAASFGMRIGAGETMLIPVASSAVGNDLIAIAPKAIVAALTADPEIETANAGTLVMDDTAPALPDTTQPEKEMFQTDSLAIKVRWPVSWALRNSAAVAWLTPSWK
jgi:Phage capsid family